MKNGKRCAAIVLAAGKGTRMGSEISKQYLPLLGKPVLFYSLQTFEKSFVDDIVIVAAENEIEYCRKEIVERFDFHKVKQIVAGGKERYHSVACGLRAVDCDYVFIHDGARPFVDETMLARLFDAVCEYGTAIAAMPVKDTVKIADEDGFAISTPDRNLVWQMQTPQTFAYRPIREAYEKLLEAETSESAGAPAACGPGGGLHITDDAMVMETFGTLKVKLVEGSYRNIKITTPEDMKIAEALMSV
ncbi:MAG: 2-C-methyl-D-erythritol 4-phosphate cytidylyltransferase [Lachnospiraceae bacterium]|nr:2-C-methyl-D-erythritol 4-phosphate cytidylyltransferase [Lachnospiraceae bacterium]